MKAANAFGLCDVHGNVWEWCEDEYHSDYEGAPGDGGAWVDGKGPGLRVLRGGNCFMTPWYARSAYRHRNDPGWRINPLGVRPARPITP